MRKVLHLEQGSDAWKAHRATPHHINGSEIAAIMGLSSYVTRAELVRQKATGIEPEHDDATLARFADGHKAEALARPIAEEIIGDDLSALVMVDEIDSLTFSVSLDGITQGNDVTFEHKRLNMTLADALDAGHLPEEYHPQCEAGLMVSGATRCLFMASKWERAPGDVVEDGKTYGFVTDGDGNLIRYVLVDEKHYWYESRPELRPKIIAACRQFLEDVANYVHVEREPAPVAATIEALPALIVQVEGRVLSTNLDAFRAKAQTFIDSIKTELVTDQDFADADKMVKFLKDGAEKLELAKQQALAQTASIDELFRTVDAISAQMRDKRLALEKLVKAEKENRKAQIITEARQAIEDHVTKLNTRTGGDWMPKASAAPFVEAIKGLKSLDSMRDRVATALAQAKIEANEIADMIEANKKIIDAVDDTHVSLFVGDLRTLLLKPTDDLKAVVAARIADHKARVETAEKAEREREEAARLAHEAQAQAADAERATLTANNQTQFDDQRGKADTGMGLADAGRAQPDAASTPPITPPLKARIDAYVADTLVLEGMVYDFIRLLPISAAEGKALRVNIMKWEKFKAAAIASGKFEAAA